MKNTFYLYEINKWSKLLPHEDIPSMPARDYIIMHIDRLQELLECESHIGGIR